MKSKFKAPKDDLRMEVRVKNNILYKAILDKYESVSAFCRDAAARGYPIREGDLGQLMNFKKSPFVKDSTEYREVCIYIERALGIPAEDLFPANLYKKVTVNKEVITFNSDRGPLALAMREVHLLPGSENMQPEIRVVTDEFKEKVEQVLRTLTYREQEIVKLFYGIGDGYQYSQEEIGRIYKITEERVKQILSKAIHKLRHPIRMEKLLPFVPKETEREKRLRMAREARQDALSRAAMERARQRRLAKEQAAKATETPPP